MIRPHPDHPRPGDFARLRTGNSIAAGPDELFVIVEDFPPHPEHLVLNLPADAPDREDWAAVVAPGEVASLTRIGPDGPRTWAPHPGPETST